MIETIHTAAIVGVILIGLIILVARFERQLNSYKRRSEIILNMFESKEYTSKDILNKIKELKMLDEVDLDIEAVCTLLKYRMRTKAQERFMKFYRRFK